MTKAYIFILFVLAVLAVRFLFFASLAFRPFDSSLLLYILLALATARMNVKIPYVQAHFSVDTAFVFIILILYGPIPAMAVDATGKIITLAANFKGSYYKIPFNLSSAVLSVFGAYLVFQGLIIDRLHGTSIYILPILGMILTYYLLNSMIVAVAICISEKQNPFRFWYKNFFPTGIGYLISGSIATLLFIIDRQGGVLGFVVVIPMVMLAYFFQRIYLQKEEDAQKYIHELEEINRQLQAEVGEHKRTQGALSHRMELEKLVNVISTQFINLPVTQVDPGIRKALQQIGRFVRFDRISVVLFSEDLTEFSVTHQWLANPGADSAEPCQNRSLSGFSWALNQLVRFNSIRVKTIDELPEEAGKLKEVFAGAAFRSVLVAPMAFNRELKGCILFVASQRTVDWPEEDVALLRTLSEIIINAVERKRIEGEKSKLEEQLVQSQKMEAIGTLAGGVAHDFNNLLTGIMGNIDMAIMGADPTTDPYLVNAQVAAKRARDVVGQLLAFSRKSQATPSVVDPTQIVREVLEMLRQTIDRRIEVHFQEPSEARTIYADPSHIYQIVMNLCLNARDAVAEVIHRKADRENRAPDRPLRIDLDVQSVLIDENYRRVDHSDWEARPGHYLVISVSDNGCGMEKETIRHIFEPFFTTKEYGKGTGLGLSTAFGLVKQHRGWINVYSEPRKGSTFRVYLPEYDGERVDVSEEMLQQEIIGGHETVLLVDDEMIVRQLGETILTRFGYRVLLAGDGAEALEVYRRHRETIDLVILDMSMPNLTGPEVLVRLQKIDPDVTVLMSSGYSGFGADQQLEGLSYTGFIPKPYGVYELTNKVRRVLDRRSGLSRSGESGAGF